MLAIGVAAVATAVSAHAGETGEEAAFRTDITPLVASHCVKCHGETKPKGGINLTAFVDAASIQKDRKTWDRVREALDSGTMPPEDKPQPAKVDVEKAIAWIDAQLSKADCRLQDNPGRVTLRRLNRTEYRNTIRDLIGIDYEPTDDFPSDDVGYGFDNIGDVLTLPPLLMERYLAAAEDITNRAIVDDNPPKPRVKNLFLGSGQGESVGRDARRLSKNGEVGVSYDFPADGDYILRVQAFGQQAGPDPVKMGFLLDKKRIHEVDVRASAKDLTRIREADYGHYEAKFKIQKGNHTLDVAFLNDFSDETNPDENKRDRDLLVRRNFWEIVGPIPIDKGRLPESHKRIIFKRPRGLQDTDTIRDLITRFASRAYRRPVTPDEVGRLMRFFEVARLDGDRFEVGMRLAVEAVLVSPNFLFRVELDPSSSTASHYISDYELASRLSYFLWSSMPDDELLDLAKQGQLRSPGTLDGQVLRMLKDPKSKALVDNFAEPVAANSPPPRREARSRPVPPV